MDWKNLRALTGSGPKHPRFPTRRRHLREMKAGEQLLVVRKHGGLGDILITSLLFESLADQYPGIDVTYAVPKCYHPLFEYNSIGLRLMSYEEVYGAVKDEEGVHFGPDSKYHEGWLRKGILEAYDLVEDISFPCHTWEQLMIKYGGVDGQGHFRQTLRWRNRLDRWARWIGVKIGHDARTIIRLRDEEVRVVRRQMKTDDRPVAIWSPVSKTRNRSYPWFREIKSLLEAEGFNVLYLHNELLDDRTLTNLSLRQMGAAVAAADIVISVDTATFHWGGILNKPTLGLFNLLLGTSHARYYPTAVTLQLCDTPCIGSRYDLKHEKECEKWHDGEAPRGPKGETFSKCFHPSSVGDIMTMVRLMSPDVKERCSGS
jgi:hypothetical protein